MDRDGITGAFGVLLTVAVLASGCGGASEPMQVTEPTAPTATTSEAPAATDETTTDADADAEAATLTTDDRRGDTPAPDLDIVRARISRDALVQVELTLAKPPGADVIYSASLSCGDQLWQLGYKDAAGTTTVFAFDFDGQQHEANGAVDGATVSISYPATEMGCTGPIDVRFVAEGTNERTPDSDYVPEPGPDALNPNRLRLGQ